MKLNEMKLEVIRFHEEDVIATSLYTGPLSRYEVTGYMHSFGFQYKEYAFENGDWVQTGSGSTGTNYKWMDDLYRANGNDSDKVYRYVKNNNFQLSKNDNGEWIMIQNGN